MSHVCDLTGKKVRTGKNVSFSNRHTARTFEPNLQEKKVWVPELGKFVKLKLSARAIRTRPGPSPATAAPPSASPPTRNPRREVPPRRGSRARPDMP